MKFVESVFIVFFLRKFLLHDFHETLGVFVLAVPIVVIGFDHVVYERFGFVESVKCQELRQHAVVILARVVEQVFHESHAVIEPDGDAFRDAVVDCIRTLLGFIDGNHRRIRKTPPNRDDIVWLFAFIFPGKEEEADVVAEKDNA